MIGGSGARQQVVGWECDQRQERRRRSVRTETRVDSFFFQAEDGIRDLTVTGVQTCALPIFNCSATDLYGARCGLVHSSTGESRLHRQGRARKVFYYRDREGVKKGIIQLMQIGRASCRERV